MYTFLLVTFWNLFLIFYLLFIPTYSLFRSILPTFLFLSYSPSLFSPNFICLLFGFCFQYTLNLLIALHICIPLVGTISWGTANLSRSMSLMNTDSTTPTILRQEWCPRQSIWMVWSCGSLLNTYQVSANLCVKWSCHVKTRLFCYRYLLPLDISFFSPPPRLHGNSWVWTLIEML